MPAEDKEALQKIAKEKCRDTSNLGLEAIRNFIRNENKPTTQPN